MSRVLFCLFLIAFPLATVQASSAHSIAQFTSKLTTLPGYFDLYWDDASGKLYADVDKLDTQFLYVSYLSAGLGSNDVSLDRGQSGATRVVQFERVGPRVLLVQPNLDYRAVSDNASEVAAVEQAFAKSVLWGFDIVAKDNDSILIDVTAFCLRDAHGVTATLKRTGQGTFARDESRSAINLDRTRNFPLNSEIDAWVSFVYQGNGKGEPPGRFVRDTAADPNTITLGIHHSFVELPDDHYKPRAFDPRAGAFSISFADYAAAIDAPLNQRWIARHRLEKQNPEAAQSDAVEPIVYYLDPGTPEPIRSALLDGARWWADAFEAIGYRDAFRVEMLPPDADMLDIRYNVIQWVHRATRGWSYGRGITDPRTGEIIKGVVSLGSLRVRQDFLIAQGLKAQYPQGDEKATEAMALALARLRQLSAHEVGHTLGFAHNFAASTNDRASVMDYPHPLVSIAGGGSIDFTDAYDEGIGEWDKFTVAYAYQDFADGVDESEALGQLVANVIDDGYRFTSDMDARPLGGAHPFAHLWDNGADPADELHRVMDVRRHALENFSAANIPKGTPLASLEEMIVPLYFAHRYQVEAVAKMVAGVDYTYAIRGDGQEGVRVVNAATQRAALSALLATLDAQYLTLSESIIQLIPPRAFQMSRHRETFDLRTGVTLDPIAIAEASAAHTLRLLLHPARANRLVEQHARDNDVPNVHEVLDAILEATWLSTVEDGLPGQVHRGVREVVLDEVMALATSDGASPVVRAIAEQALEDLTETLEKKSRRASGDSKVQMKSAARRIERFLENPQSTSIRSIPSLPPGSPIGHEFCSTHTGW